MYCFSECSIEELHLEENGLSKLTLDNSNLTNLIKITFVESFVSNISIQSDKIPLTHYKQRSKLSKFPSEDLNKLNQTLEFLDLDKNVIQEIDHDFLVSMGKLRSLHIRINEISTWPSVAANQTQQSIAVIDLGNNKLTTINMTYLSLFQHLGNLNLGNNDLVSIDSGFPLFELHSCRLSNSKFDGYNGTYKALLLHMPNVTWLTISSSLLVLPNVSELSLIPNLAKLFFGGNKISTLHLNIFTATPNIQVRLSENTFPSLIN